MLLCVFVYYDVFWFVLRFCGGDYVCYLYLCDVFCFFGVFWCGCIELYWMIFCCYDVWLICVCDDVECCCVVVDLLCVFVMC